MNSIARERALGPASTRRFRRATRGRGGGGGQGAAVESTPRANHQAMTDR